MKNTITEQVPFDKIISNVNNHGALLSLKAKSMDALTELLNEQQFPYALKGLLFGEGMYYALIELERNKKIKFKKNRR